MMKKIVSVFVLAAGVLLSSQAFAAKGVLLAGGNISALQCTALSNDVNIQLSNKVVAAWGCTTTSLYAATCHQNGTNKSQSLPCDWTAVDDGAGNITYQANSGQCPAWDGSGTKPVASFTFVGRVGFVGGSGGGSVTSAELTSASCDAAGSAAQSLIPAGY